MTEETTMTEPTIIYPDAADLDSGGWDDTSGRWDHLYLIPADETEHGKPEVIVHGGVGTSDMPMAAWHRRWARVASYGPMTVGASVLERLRAMEDILLAASASYQGTEWDGNYCGSWDTDDAGMTLLDAYDWDETGIELRHYWDAADWFVDADGWLDLAREAGVDPERVLGDGWESVAREVAEAIEPIQEEPVTGTERLAIDWAEGYRDERSEGCA